MELESTFVGWSEFMMTRAMLSLCGAILLAACGGKGVDASGETDGDVPAEGDACQPDDADPPCVDGLVCEVNGGGYLCAVPLEIRGIVVDALTEQPIDGARVTALDAAGLPVGSVSVSDAQGRYAVRARAARNEDGSFADASTWTLFATAADYQPFPGGLRPAIPINAANADHDDDTSGWLLENGSTDVALLPLPSDLVGGRT
ncbi:MAG: hypothetical protein KUG77_09770, partial [Nannocystaceae bacterium]|nr:hypothetical protein [Nannocystaceae bacterium]